MNQFVLAPEVQQFISDHEQDEITAVLLKGSPFPQVTVQELAQQIQGRKIARRKFPFLLKEHILFPPHLNLEQSSSQVTAEYKAGLISGNRFLDLTAGFGIDAFFMSQSFSDVSLVEQNTGLLDVVRHNWQTLGKNATFINSPLQDFINTETDSFDVVFLDPARRDDAQRKKFLLSDLSPDILTLREELLKLAPTVVIKLSPLIDISYLLSVLDCVSDIHLIAVKNEMKEVVVVLKKGWTAEPVITCVNLESQQPSFNFYVKEEISAQPEFSEPLNYLYLPNAAVLKAGAFNLISERFKLRKLHPNSHLYTSGKHIPDFPGRSWSAELIKAGELKKRTQYNIISRNHPLTPEQIKKKYGLRDGGDLYLIFTQSVGGKQILRCTPV